MHVFERARTKYHMFRTHGPHMVSKKLIQIMSTLLPLRRICSGGQLSDKDLAVVSIFIHAQHDSLASSKLIASLPGWCCCLQSDDFPECL